MFVLGIGKDVDPSELKKIASGPDNVFTVDSSNALDDKSEEVKRGICILGTDCQVVVLACPCPGYVYIRLLLFWDSRKIVL